MVKKYIIIIVTVLLNSCIQMDDPGLQITCINNSSTYVMIYRSYFYPDTSLISNRNDGLSMSTSATFWIAWDEDDLRKRCKSDTLSFFFLDYSVWENNPWDTIRKNYMILKRKDYWVEDLIRTKEIEYP